MLDSEKRPVLVGLLALVTVAGVVGLLIGGAMLFGVKALGLDGGVAGGDNSPTSGQTLYLPEPTDTGTPTPTTTPTETPGEMPAETEPTAPATEITLSAAQDSVSPMQQIDLSGSFSAGEGAVLQVQIKTEGGKWSDFPVTARVSNGTFTTYVQTSQPGKNRFRMRDTDSDMVSNVVRVTVA